MGSNNQEYKSRHVCGSPFAEQAWHSSDRKDRSALELQGHTMRTAGALTPQRLSEPRCSKLGGGDEGGFPLEVVLC